MPDPPTQVLYYGVNLVSGRKACIQAGTGRGIGLKDLLFVSNSS